MVFRAKVRDGDKLYSPLGLELRRHRGRLPGRGQRLSLRHALLLLSGADLRARTRWSNGCAGTRAARAYYAAQFRHVFGKKLDDAWDDWIAWERTFQRANLAGCRAYPLTEVTHLSPKGLGSMSRGFVDAKTNALVARLPLSRRDRLRRHAWTSPPASSASSPRSRGMMLYKVTSLAFDPDGRKAYYTEDNYAFRDLIEIDVDTGKKRHAAEGRADRRHRRQPAPTSRLWGIRHQNGFATHRPHSAALCRLQPDPYLRLWDQSRSISTSRPTARCFRRSFGEVDGDAVGAGLVGEGVSWRWRGPRKSRGSTSPPSTPESFVFSPDGRSLFGSSYYTGVSNIFRFDIATQEI